MNLRIYYIAISQVFFSSVKEAYETWRKTPSIWKISWGENGKDFRFRVKTKKDSWSFKTEEKLCTLSEEYRGSKTSNSKPGQIFFVHQSVLPPNQDELARARFKEKSISEEEYALAQSLGCIQEVLTEEQFVKKYC